MKYENERMKWKFSFGV